MHHSTVSALCPIEPDFPAHLFDVERPDEQLAELVEGYSRDRAGLVEIAGLFAGERLGLVQHFLEGNGGELRHGSAEFAARRMFELGGAVAALSASYWRRALALTGILEAMPQERRSAWHEQLAARETPEFTADAVRATIGEHLARRHHYFAERVDGVFKALSPGHLTNTPQGFRKRMILAHVHDGLGVNFDRCGTINDLRIVIAKFRGREDPLRQETRRVIETGIRRRGEWLELDGGALRIRVYKVGTCHIEVHPDMAARLNAVLAYLHPNAIPEQHRRRPRTRTRPPIERVDRLLPPAVIRLLCELRTHDGREFDAPYTWARADKHVRAAAERVMLSIGAERTSVGFRLGYRADGVIDSIIASGSVPDQRSHQYYPTPRALAERAVALADVAEGDRVLEPSAGQGALAELLPSGTTCVEASALYCEILEAKGLDAHRGDFLQFRARPFDAIVMNPPFDRGQWRTHLAHACTLLAEDGRIVAVLPASAAKADPLPGWACSFTEPITRAFADASVSVTIMLAERTL